MTEKQYKWKGKFVTEKKYKCMKIRTENGKKRRKLEPESSHIVQGHRIIDIDHVAKSMHCSFCKERLHLEDITKEIVKGAASIFDVQCKNCLKKNTVTSGKEYTNPSTGRRLFTINTKTALGVIHAGAGSTQLKKIFSCMDLPNINDQLFKKHERIIGPIVEFVAKESCSEAAIAERTLTLENITELKKLLPEKLQDGFLILNIEPSESNPEGKIVRIFASYDMGWSQRSNGYSYDSLNGYCAIIGLKTGKILDFCTRNRKCRICDLGLINGKIKEHDCRLNCYSSSKAMEADGAVQLVTNSNILKTANIEVGVFIGDNDSCCIASIQNAINYEIVKQSDMNHTTKGVGNTLHEIHNSKVSDPDRELSNDTIKHLQRCFTYAVKQNQGNISKVQAALKNIPYHIFGYHENCSQWCQDNADKENYTGIRLKNATLFEVLKNTFTKLADNAEKFAAAASSQTNESLNNSMCSKAPKRISYSTSESADYRFACTVAQKNYGTDYLRRSMDAINFPWNSQLNKYVERSTKISLKKKEKASKPEFKKRRLELKSKRSQLRHRKEQIEGDTYKSNMGLFNETLGIENCIKKVTGDNFNYNTQDIAVVFFDLETGGFDLSREILQICMKCEELQFDSFITPTKAIDNQATKINGLSRVNKQLFHNGEEVVTFPRRMVFLKLLEYFKNIEKKCILVAHNCSFDSIRFILAVKELSLLQEYKNYILGFSDTLLLFRKKYPNKKNGYKLTTLATELLSLSSDDAHDARFDVELLEKLSVTFLDIAEIIESKKSIEEVLIRIEKNANTKKILSSFKPMNNVISASMQKRLAESGISYDILVNKYRSEGKDKTIHFLRNEVNGKPQLIKSNKILNNILEYLNSFSFASDSNVILM